jgi:hypothetical protein
VARQFDGSFPQFAESQVRRRVPGAPVLDGVGAAATVDGPGRSGAWMAAPAGRDQRRCRGDQARRSSRSQPAARGPPEMPLRANIDLVQPAHLAIFSALKARIFDGRRYSHATMAKHEPRHRKPAVRCRSARSDVPTRRPAVNHYSLLLAGPGRRARSVPERAATDGSQWSLKASADPGWAGPPKAGAGDETIF